MQETFNLYTEIFNNLKNAIGQNFKEQLKKEQKIETFDQKWKPVRQNIEMYLRNFAQQNAGIEKYILSDGYFLYEDVAALFLELVWQDSNSKLEILDTIFFYKNYKVQIGNENLLTN